MLRVPHRVPDLVGERGPPNVPERPRQPARDVERLSRQQAAHDPAHLPDPGKRRSRLHGTVPEELGRYLHQRGIHGAYAQSLPLADVRRLRHDRRPEVEQGGLER